MKKKRFLKIISIIILIIFFVYLLFYLNNYVNFKKIDLNFKYHNYEKEIITKKMKKYSSWELGKNEVYFINGVIRKYKPRFCLEIGVAEGGSSILILNAIKDIKNSSLVSLDLYTKFYANPSKNTGHCVKKYFPELANNWLLFTGEQPHKFLEKLNMKFDFLFLDTVHLAPGELINIIEALPFLNDNAIIILHDIMFHLPSNRYYNPYFVKYHPSQIFLMTSLFGDKVTIIDNNKIENIGAVFLYPNQKKFYFNYFLLLLTPWDYLPNENHIKELKLFIKKYYKNETYLYLFNRAIDENKIYVNKFNLLYKNLSKILNAKLKK